MTKIKSADKDSQLFTGQDLIQSCSLFSTITLKQVHYLAAVFGGVSQIKTIPVYKQRENCTKTVAKLAFL